jgi:hypothetical protein
MEFTEATCKKIVTCGGVASTAELDGVTEGVVPLSPLVDDVVSELPAPVSMSRVTELVGLCGGMAVNMQAEFVGGTSDRKYLYSIPKQTTPHWLCRGHI